LRYSVGKVTPCFNLDEDQNFILNGDYIDLTTLAVEVTLDNAVAM
jgi:hypothetical protein